MPTRSTFPPGSDCRTQMHLARQGDVSPEMQRVAEREELPEEVAAARERIAALGPPPEDPVGGEGVGR